MQCTEQGCRKVDLLDLASQAKKKFSYMLLLAKSGCLPRVAECQILLPVKSAKSGCQLKVADNQKWLPDKSGYQSKVAESQK